MEHKKDDLSSIAHAIGNLSGQMTVQHASTLDAINVIRQDIKRVEEANKQGIDQLEKRIDGKFKSIGDRVEKLENAEKENIKSSTKTGVIVGGMATALTVVAIEFIKRFH